MRTVFKVNRRYIELMQSSFHVLSLVSEARRDIVGGTLVGTRFYKKARAALFDIKGERSHNTLAFLFHPTGSGTMVVPRSKLTIDTTEKPWPIFGMSSGIITAVDQLHFDRIVRLTISAEAGTRYIIIEAIGQNGNIWYLDNNQQILASLRNREYESGVAYSPPDLPDKLNPLTMTAESLCERLKECEGLPLETALQRSVFAINATLSQEIVHRSSCTASDVAELTIEDCRAIRDTLLLLASWFSLAERGTLYTINGRPEVYPFRLSSVELHGEGFKSFSLAVLEASQRAHVSRESEDIRKTVTDAVRREIKKIESRLSKLDADIAQAQNFETFKRHGDLLKINFDKLRRGMHEITVEDILHDAHPQVVISLDSASTPNENVESYYQRHRKGKEGLDVLQRRKEISIAELARMRNIANALNKDFDSASEQFADEISPLVGGSVSKEAVSVRLPYKAMQLSTGLTIFIGRDGSDNDRTTFEFAKPYELWFHTQQCPGSHVVMKFPNKQFQPSRREIEETAAVAAWHSKARNDTLVPVCYTERRFVRKLRKAKPGLVTVEKEKSVMVVPRKPGGADKE